MTKDPKPVWTLEAALGEGPVWVGRDRALWFTDIKQRKIHRYDPDEGSKRSWDSPDQIGFLFPRNGGGFVTGLKSGLHYFDERTGTFDRIAAVDPGHPNNRLNDGAVAPDGALWFGTMDDGEQSASGSYYRFLDGSLKPTGIGGIAITNGPALSPDGRTLYWVDTRGRRIFACSVQDGEVGESVLFAEVAAGEGNPDGPTIDAEGCVWVGMYGGWEARRYSPGGKLIDRVSFPVANITKIAFGGQDLRTAYATSARHLASPEELEHQPLAGALFEFDAGVAGIACPEVRA